MTNSVAREINGIVFEAMSSGWCVKVPIICVPVNAAEIADEQAIGRWVKQLVSAARLAQAEETADWIEVNSRRSLRFGKEILVNYKEQIDQMMTFEGQSEYVDRAIAIIRAAEAEVAARKSTRESKRRQRADLQKVYSETFVKLGRRDGFECRACGSASQDLQIDHALPVAKGGTNDLDNLQILCKTCNALKGDKVEVADG